MYIIELPIVQIRKLIKKEMNYIPTMEKEKERGSVQKREKGKRDREGEKRGRGKEEREERGSVQKREKGKRERREREGKGEEEGREEKGTREHKNTPIRVCLTCSGGCGSWRWSWTRRDMVSWWCRFAWRSRFDALCVLVVVVSSRRRFDRLRRDVAVAVVF